MTHDGGTAFLPYKLQGQGNRQVCCFSLSDELVSCKGEHTQLSLEKKKVRFAGPHALPWLHLPGLAPSSGVQHHVSQGRTKERPVQQQPYMPWNLFFFTDFSGFTCFISQHLPDCVAVTTKPQCRWFSIAKVLSSSPHLCCVSAVSWV